MGQPPTVVVVLISGKKKRKKRKEKARASGLSLLTKLVSRTFLGFLCVTAVYLLPTSDSLLPCSPPSGKQVLSPELVLSTLFASTQSELTCLSQAVSAGQRRFLSIHEYQSVNLLNSVCAPRLLSPIGRLLLCAF